MSEVKEHCRQVLANTPQTSPGYSFLRLKAHFQGLHGEQVMATAVIPDILCEINMVQTK